MRWTLFPAAVLFTVLTGCGIQTSEPMHGTELWEISVEGVMRTALVHPPAVPGTDLPVLLAFHGGYGTAGGMEQTYGITPLADQKGFIAVYPQGLDRHWNDGREDPDDLSDVRFTEALLDSLCRRYSIDAERIYATGMSNGAIFCHFLADGMPGVLAGIAPVCGGIADPGYEWFAPGLPADVCIIQGTEDPLVPYGGGEIGFRGGRGGVLTTVEAVEKWRSINGCAQYPAVTSIPDLAPDDGCAATMYFYTGIRDVALVRIDGGGHCWPGGEQYLPGRVIGSLCEDFHAEELIWEFFTEAMENREEAPPDGETQDGRTSTGRRQ